MIDPQLLGIAIASLGIASLIAMCIAVTANAKAHAATDLARGTSERSQKLGRMLGEMNDIIETLDMDLCKEIDKVKASIKELEP